MTGVREQGYERLAHAIASDRCVILDGGVATELEGHAALEDPSWGTRELRDDPEAVLRVHRSYVDAGCDVISTNTWGVLSAGGHWMDLARRGLELARAAAGERAVAFSLNGDAELGDE